MSAKFLLAPTPLCLEFELSKCGILFHRLVRSTNLYVHFQIRWIVSSSNRSTTKRHITCQDARAIVYLPFASSPFTLQGRKRRRISSVFRFEPYPQPALEDFVLTTPLTGRPPHPNFFESVRRRRRVLSYGCHQGRRQGGYDDGEGTEGERSFVGEGVCSAGSLVGGTDPKSSGPSR